MSQSSENNEDLSFYWDHEYTEKLKAEAVTKKVRLQSLNITFRTILTF
jgi:hypothetical protein